MSVPTSIRALQEVTKILYERCDKKFNSLKDEQTTKINEGQRKLSESIEKDLEAWAITKYSQYSLAVIPVCHRSSTYKDSDVVRAELRVKAFPKEIIASYKEKARISEEFAKAKKAIDDWHFAAATSIASKESLPKMPEF